MAKGKYQDWLTEDGLLLLSAMARDGKTDEQIADKIGISRSTLSEWKVQYSDIADALKKNKDVFDIEVEEALHKKTLGYNVELKKTFKVKHVVYSEETGKKIGEVETLETGIEEIHVPADTMAQMYWLNNRRSEQWRNKREQVQGNGDIEDLTPLAELLAVDDE